MDETTQKLYTIGLDLGGTNSVFGIVDVEGNILELTSVKTQEYATPEAYLEDCVKALKPLIEKVGGLDTIKSMGIGAPNANIITGCIENAPNINWAHNAKVPLAEMFSKELGGLKVSITNDANAAAIGEMTFGAARGMKDFIVITLGTGVGSGIVCGGNLLYGHDGNAGELGHVIVERDGRLCGCGRKGCLETYCSATGVARTARQFIQDSAVPSLLRDMKPEEITSFDVYKAAEKGDAMALHVFEYTGEILGRACADMAAFSSPEAFIFFGGLAKAGDMLLDHVKKAYDENVMPVFKGKAKFLKSTLEGAGAAVLGAASL